MNVSTDHWVPSHRSTSITGSSIPLDAPAATHSLLETHETLANPDAISEPTFGVGSDDQ